MAGPGRGRQWPRGSARVLLPHAFLAFLVGDLVAAIPLGRRLVAGLVAAVGLGGLLADRLVTTIALARMSAGNLVMPVDFRFAPRQVLARHRVTTVPCGLV